MKEFKEPTLEERRLQAAKARQAQLEAAAARKAVAEREGKKGSDNLSAAKKARKKKK